MTINNQGLKSKIDAIKLTVKEKYAVCKVAAGKLVSAYKQLKEAEEVNSIKNTSKTLARYAKAESGFNAAKKEYASFLKIYDALVDEVLAAYDQLIAEEGAKTAKKLRNEAEKFETKECLNRENLEARLKDIAGLEDAARESQKPENKLYDEPLAFEGKEEKTSAESLEKRAEPRQPEGREFYQPNPYQPYGAPYYTPYDAYRTYPQQGVNIAPASIDISAIVEDAVASAMEKFKAAFSKRADEFTESLPNTEPTASANVAASGVVSSAIVGMESEIAENEREIADRLLEIIENLKKLSAGLTELGAAYIELSNVQGDAAGAQRRINDMQRSVSREIQGVQATQKVINQDQAQVSGEQAALVEAQKANVENQMMLNSAQSEIAEMQKNLLEAQNALEESVRGVIASQKSIISSQQSVISANAKNAELARELTERQAEVNAYQKSVMQEHKHLSRASRVKTKPQKDEALVSEISVEAPVNEEKKEKVAVSDEVELEALQLES